MKPDWVEDLVEVTVITVFLAFMAFALGVLAITSNTEECYKAAGSNPAAIAECRK